MRKTTRNGVSEMRAHCCIQQSRPNVQCFPLCSPRLFFPVSRPSNNVPVPSSSSIFSTSFVATEGFAHYILRSPPRWWVCSISRKDTPQKRIQFAFAKRRNSRSSIHHQIPRRTPRARACLTFTATFDSFPPLFSSTRQ